MALILPEFGDGILRGEESCDCWRVCVVGGTRIRVEVEVEAGKERKVRLG